MWLLLAALSADPSKEASACFELAKSNIELIGCAREEYDRQDARLNKIYKQVMGKQDPTGADLLRKAELAWITFRDTHCAFEADLMRDGSGAPLIDWSCRADMTRKRAEDLEAWWKSNSD
jgi:uncharacterized protein YecT (DUF1311 family)